MSFSFLFSKCVSGGTDFSEFCSSVMGVVFHPNDNTLASCSLDKSIKLWNLDTGAELSTMSGHLLNVSCLAFKPDDPNILVSGSFDKTLKIWDLSRAACLSTVNVDSAVRSVAYSPSGDTVAVGCHRGKVLLVDTLTGQVMLSLRGHNGRDDCICHFDVLGRLVGAVNPQCPVSGHSDW
jgi:WD40 repeat protein